MVHLKNINLKYAYQFFLKLYLIVLLLFHGCAPTDPENSDDNNDIRVDFQFDIARTMILDETNWLMVSTDDSLYQFANDELNKISDEKYIDIRSHISNKDYGWFTTKDGNLYRVDKSGNILMIEMGDIYNRHFKVRLSYNQDSILFMNQGLNGTLDAKVFIAPITYHSKTDFKQIRVPWPNPGYSFQYVYYYEMFYTNNRLVIFGNIQFNQTQFSLEHSNIDTFSYFNFYDLGNLIATAPNELIFKNGIFKNQVSKPYTLINSSEKILYYNFSTPQYCVTYDQTNYYASLILNTPGDPSLNKISTIQQSEYRVLALTDTNLYLFDKLKKQLVIRKLSDLKLFD